ncbi:MAG: glycosyltransferase family 2 protein [Bacteroidales bacterium]|jgi:glycosyltransferase involved in cell wall biosynthesis
MEETLFGGTRLNGQSPLKVPGLPVVSVITVVYNSLSLIEKTLCNVIAQTYPNIEYIVVDGGSTDGTNEIIRLYETQISYWISEPDRGIYDAMNKGLAAATGDFVWFMNAGDLIYTADTLEKVMTGDESSGNDGYGLIYYGDTMIVDSSYHEIGLRRLRPPEVLTWQSFKKGMLVCHQAIIVNRTIATPYDPRYGHSADFDWVIKALKKAQGPRLKAQVGNKEKVSGMKGIVNTHRVLCAFLDGGHSKKNIGISLRERFHSMVSHYGLIPTVVRHVPIAVRFGWYYLKNKRF